MPKRKSDKEKKWRRKLKKYEGKLRNRRRRSASSEDNRSASASPLPDSIRGHHQGTPPPPPLPASPSPEFQAETAPSLHEEASTSPSPELGTALPEPLEKAAIVPAPDPELLQALGIFEAECEEWGPEISDDLSKRWAPILKDGLNKEARDSLLKKYIPPKNCPLMRPPSLNPEIAAVLNESAKNRDGRLIKKQAQLGCAFTALGRTMSSILNKTINTPEILKNLAETAQVLADAHFSETETRRSLITPVVDKNLLEQFKNRKRDSQLFGDKLGDFITSSRGIQKTGKLIQANLNSKAPASRYQQSQRPARQTHRAGETRAAQYQHDHRRARFHPGPSYRGPPPPPQPPQPSAVAPAPAAPPHYRKQTAAANYKRKQ